MVGGEPELTIAFMEVVVPEDMLLACTEMGGFAELEFTVNPPITAVPVEVPLLDSWNSMTKLTLLPILVNDALRAANVMPVEPPPKVRVGVNVTSE